ncbi:MAG: hypothetical protein HY736_09245 [Verrucomicrobia bacterium]|nr:hypothetical protein [Verrucomicrobiota bacterium]
METGVGKRRPYTHQLVCAGAVLLAVLFLFPVFSARAADIAPRMLLLDGAVAGPDIVAVGERGTILRSTDNARTWQTATTPTGATLTGVSFAPDGQHGWAVGHDALIVATADGGRTWSQQYQGENLQDSFLDVLAVDAQRVIAVGAYSLFATTANGGRSWVRRKVLAEDYHLNRLSRGPTGTLYLAGEHGTLLRSSDNGETWTSIAAPYDGSFYGIVPLDRRTLIAHGLRGRVYRSIDDGASWEPVATPQPVLLATALKLKSNFLVFAGQARALLLSRDYGKSLVPSPAALTTATAELLEIPDGSILALGEAGATLLAQP